MISISRKDVSTKVGASFLMTQTLLHYWWVPATIFYYCVTSWLTVLVKDEQGWKYFIILQAVQLLSLWAIVAKFSRNIVFDGMLFDVLILASFYVMMFSLGQMEGFTGKQWTGCAFCVLGLLMIKKVF